MTKYIFALFLLAFSLAFAPNASAAETFKSFTLDDLQVIALSDTLPASRPGATELLIGLSDKEKAAIPPEAMTNSINAFVVRTSEDVVLFDTGLGQDGQRKGALLNSLNAAGLSPNEITLIAITHFHPDHIGGLTASGKPVFTKARLTVPRLDMEANADAAARLREAYGERLSSFDWNEAVGRGIVALDAAGHTEGHTVFLVTEGAGALLVAGDLIHFGGVQLANPGIAVTYDKDPKKAVEARKREFAMAAQSGLPVASMHLPFPGLGRLEKSGEGYTFNSIEK